MQEELSVEIHSHEIFWNTFDIELHMRCPMLAHPILILISYTRDECTEQNSASGSITQCFPEFETIEPDPRVVRNLYSARVIPVDRKSRDQSTVELQYGYGTTFLTCDESSRSSETCHVRLLLRLMFYITGVSSIAFHI